MPNKERYARDKARAAAASTTPYKIRMEPKLAQGFSVSQSRGHAREKRGERKVSEVKKIAKEQNLPVERVHKIKPGLLGGGEGKRGEADWRSISIPGYLNLNEVYRVVLGLPNRSRVWMLVEVDETTYYTIYARGTRTTGENHDQFWITVITNRSKQEMLSVLENFSYPGLHFDDADMSTNVLQTVIRYKPL